MTICHSSDITFNNDLQKEGYTLVNFWASWCNPCRMLAPVLEAYDANSRDDVRILKINVDDYPETASSFSVMSLPTTILFQDGKLIDKKIGFMSKEALAEWVDGHI